MGLVVGVVVGVVGGRVLGATVGSVDGCHTVPGGSWVGPTAAKKDGIILNYWLLCTELLVASYQTWDAN